MDERAKILKETKLKSTILSEDGTLKYDFMTFLQKISMARIVNILWINKDTQKRMVDFYQQLRYVSCGSFFPIEQSICAKILQLSLPISICKELKDLVSVFKDFIFNWIAYHDDYIFNTDESGYSAVNLIHNITWTARGKIDYLQTARNILRCTYSQICDDHKYKLACTYCLEDEIYFLSDKLINTIHLSRTDINKYPMVYFWKKKITGYTSRVRELPFQRIRIKCYGDRSINKYIMQLLLMNNGIISNRTINVVPIRFMWNELSKDEKAQHISLLFEKVDNTDFLISFLSNLDYDQQHIILKEHAYKILHVILGQWWWWGDYFLPTALNVLDIMDTSSLWKVLHEICEKSHESSQKKIYDHFKSLFKLLWQERSTQLKEYIFYNETKLEEMFRKSELHWKKDMDIIEVILNDLNEQQKKNIGLSFYGVLECIHFIEDDEWDLLDLFIKCILSSEEDVNHLKQRVIKDSGRRIVQRFSRERELHKLQRFMTWAFKSEEDIYNFYQSIGSLPPSIRQNDRHCRIL